MKSLARELSAAMTGRGMAMETQLINSDVRDQGHKSIQGFRWDSEKVKNTHLTIVGTGPLANYLTVYAAGLGIGNVRLIGNEEMLSPDINEFLICGKEQGKYKVELLGNELSRLNPQIDVTTKTCYVAKQDVGQNTLEFLIDVTNNPDSKLRCIKIADELKAEGKPIKYFISASSSLTKASVSIYTPGKGASPIWAKGKIEEPIAKDVQAMEFSIDEIVGQNQGWFGLSFPDGIVEGLLDKGRKPMSARPPAAGSANDIVGDLLGTSNVSDYLTCLRQPKQVRERRKYDMNSVDTHLMGEYEREEQGNVTSGVIASLILDEIRKAILPRECEVEKRGGREKITILENRFDYNLLSNERFSIDDDIYITSSYTRNELKSKKVLVVGGGGIGTYALLNLAIMGVGEITLIEPDRIEGSNYNRQFQYVGHDGELKAEVMKQKLEQLNPLIKVIQFPELVKKGTLDRIVGGRKIDLILGCVDNWEARYYVNLFAAARGIPYMDGNLDAFDGKIEFFSPGESPCLDCKVDYKGKSDDTKKKEKEIHDNIVELIRQRAKSNPELRDKIKTMEGLEWEVAEYNCRNNRNGSIVMSNAYIGTLMAAEALTYLIPRQYSNRIANKTITYSSNLEDRLSVVDSDSCACSRIPEKDRCVCHKDNYPRRSG